MGLTGIPERVTVAGSVSRPPAVTRWVGAVRSLAVASLVAQVLVIGTGGAVRLTDSGLGCPTWPRCTDGSYVNTPAYGIHGFIEFGNRLLTVALTVLTLVTLVAAVRARPVRRDHRLLALALMVGIPVQAVLGGLSVLSKLNPWVVSVHYLCSALLVAVATVFVHRTRTGVVDGPRLWRVPRPVRGLTIGLAAATAAVVYAGTIVTGSGPHAGNTASARTGLDPAEVAQLHADLVTLLIGLTIGLAVAVGLTVPDPRAWHTVVVLLVVEGAQAAVGWIQYFTGLPVGLVDLHLVGAAIVVSLATRAVLTTRAPSGPDLP
jgi:cytochrome c oxidase assembly protein subunit 15